MAIMGICLNMHLQFQGLSCESSPPLLLLAPGPDPLHLFLPLKGSPPLEAPASSLLSAPNDDATGTCVAGAYLHTYAHKHVDEHIYMFTYIYAYVHTYIHTNMKTDIHTYILIFIYTYTHK